MVRDLWHARSAWCRLRLVPCRPSTRCKPMARSAAASGCKPQSYRRHYMLVCIENSKEQSIMNTLRQGAVAGLLAGLILGMLGFVDYGPGNPLGGVARWLALDNRATGRGAGFLMLIVLGGLFGLLFGFLQRNREVTLSRSLVLGLAVGAAFWLIVTVLLGAVIFQAKFDLGIVFGLFQALVLLLVYGTVVGTIYFQSVVRRVGEA